MEIITLIIRNVQEYSIEQKKNIQNRKKYLQKAGGMILCALETYTRIEFLYAN